MSYMSDEMERSFRESLLATATCEASYAQGFIDGFRETVLAYGIWRNGTQVIGCLETPIAEEMYKQFPADFPIRRAT
jgi:hypothetical protein